MNITRTGSLEVPVTLDEVKAHARIDEDITDQDPVIMGYMIAATEYFDGVDGYLGRSLMSSGFQYELDEFPAEGIIALPMPPLVSVESISYIDSDGVSQTWDASNYSVDANSTPGRIIRGYDIIYPSTRDVPNAVTISYTAGYGANLADVPQRIRTAISVLASHMYVHRTPVVLGTIATEVPNGIRALVDNYRMF